MYLDIVDYRLGLEKLPFIELFDAATMLEILTAHRMNPVNIGEWLVQLWGDVLSLLGCRSGLLRR